MADADVLIDLLRNHQPAVEWFRGLEETPSVPGIVVMELIQGCRNASEVQAVQTLVKPMRLAWPSEGDCQQALSDFSVRRLSHGMGLLDALIAATARGLVATLCTFNVAHYRSVPDLQVTQPYVR